MDIGVHQDGLVHISQISDKFVHNPADVVKLHQKVMVTVLDVDKDRKRISLSMKAKVSNEAKGKRAETASVIFAVEEVPLLPASTRLDRIRSVLPQCPLHLRQNRLYLACLPELEFH